MAINTVINTNVMALTAHRNLGTVGNRQNKANQRLSSGKKINSAADDAAGLAISEKMKAQIKGLDMASKNSEDAISLIQTAEGSLTEVNNMLTRIRELTVQAGNDTNQQQDRVKIAEEVASLLTEVDSISSRTEFNEKKLNDGTFEKGHFQIGANSGQKLELSIGNMSVKGIGMNQIMDTFGIEKKVDLNITSSQETALQAGEKSSMEVTMADGTLTGNTEVDAKLGEATVKLKYNENGVEKTLDIKVDLSAVGVDAADATKIKKEDLASALAAQLNSSDEFKNKFEVSADNAGKLTFNSANEGGEIEFTSMEITYGKAQGTTATKDTVTNGTGNAANQVQGNYGTINVNDLADGETLTIGGKTFTKVAAGNPKEITNGFSDVDELSTLLANEQIDVDADTNTGTVKINFVDHQKTGLAGDYSVKEKEVSDKGKDYSKTLDIIDDSLKQVTTQRAKLGANQNRLEYTINSLNLSSENLSAAKSRIEDTDMAKEMMNLTSANVLQQAATSILAQANQAPNNITQLLG